MQTSEHVGSEADDISKRLDGMDQGADFCINDLARQLGVTEWEQGDGTEEWEGDVSLTIRNVLREAGVINEDGERNASRAQIARMRAALSWIGSFGEAELDDAGEMWTMARIALGKSTKGRAVTSARIMQLRGILAEIASEIELELQ